MCVMIGVRHDTCKEAKQVQVVVSLDIEQSMIKDKSKSTHPDSTSKTSQEKPSARERRKVLCESSNAVNNTQRSTEHSNKQHACTAQFVVHILASCTNKLQCVGLDFVPFT